MDLSRLNVIDAGISSEMPFDQSRRIRLVNVSALLASGTTVPYLFIFFAKGLFLGPVALAFFFSFCSCWFLNQYQYYRTARVVLYIFSCAYLFIVASALGRAAGHQLMLIPVLLSGVLVFEFQEKAKLFLFIGLVLASFLALELSDFSLFSITVSTEEQLYFYYGSLTVAVLGAAVIGVFYFFLYGKQLEENQAMIKTGQEIEQTINYFSTSLFGKNTVDEILWDVAKNCIGRLGFVDCVIYLLDEEQGVLRQKAAFGEKNPYDFVIHRPIDIPVGKGIVGFVAKHSVPVIVNDTSKDERYLKDDQLRMSEMAVPLVYNKRVIGVIDSEHPEKHFFTERHLNVLKTISSLCANKVARAHADTERSRALKARMEAEKIKTFDELKSKFFANISHELRTPLTLVMGTIDKHLSDNENNDWRTLKTHTDRLLRLINQLLDLTKAESGHFKLNNEPADITAFLKNTLSLFSSVTYSRSIELKKSIPEEPLWLMFDQDALEKIIFNLLSNAVKFTSEDSVVELSVNYEKALVIKVSDEGDGIPKDEIDKIFDRFYQIGKNHSSGTGIGLALTKELVELHKGTITVESELGRGTSFIVSLPLEVAEVPDDRSSELDNYPPFAPDDKTFTDKPEEHKPLVLLIEDNEELSTFIKNELFSEFQIIQQYDGAAGLEEAKIKLPDLIISDVMMPKIDGLELCQLLKEDTLTDHIPVIILTALADQESKLEGLQMGADDYLVKPFHADELKARMNNLLDQRKKLSKKFSQVITLRPNDIVITSVQEVFIKKLISTVETNMGREDFNVEELCYEMGISRMQMHRKLTALTGQSTSAFIRQLRLQKAVKLLESGQNVSQAAYAVGFNSLSYFTKLFKAQYGVPPSEHLLAQS
ncbi:MAG: ATP-binding protein [Reichenbachiella sp.]|uniref:ATP-binding protein n=1 Tax=Reichenbachiella sp. TaxID=2184521 RepID=UPI003265C361